MSELNAAVQLAVLLRGVGDGRVGFAAAGDPEGVIGLVQLRLQHPRHGGSPLTRQNQTMVRTAEVIGVANDADPTWTTAVDHLSQLSEPSPYARDSFGAPLSVAPAPDVAGSAAVGGGVETAALGALDAGCCG
jgi:hypothetical protein